MFEKKLIAPHHLPISPLIKPPLPRVILRVTVNLRVSNDMTDFFQKYRLSKFKGLSFQSWTQSSEKGKTMQQNWRRLKVQFSSGDQHQDVLSSFEEIISGVPQDSVAGLRLFNTFFHLLKMHQLKTFQMTTSCLVSLKQLTT